MIVHQLTALTAVDPRHMERDFELTNRLRTEGTDHLLSAGQAVGVRRFVAQSFGAISYERSGGPVKSEEDALDPEPAPEMRGILAAIRYLEQAVLGARWTEGIARIVRAQSCATHQALHRCLRCPCTPCPAARVGF